MNMQESVSLSVSPIKVAKILFIIALFVTSASLLGAYIQLYMNYDDMHRYVHHLVEKMNVDAELSVPAFFAVVLLLIASGLSWFVGHNQPSHDSFANRWAFLAFVFLFLAMDECIGFHEYLNGSTFKAYQSMSKYLRWTWVIPYTVVTITFFVLYVPFLRSLPVRVAGMMVMAGAIYVAGAVGVEMLGAGFYTIEGKNSLSYKLTTHLEEMMEMTGLILFIYSQTDYIRERWLIAIEHKRI